MIDAKKLYDWQQRLLAQPRIWTVYYGDEPPGNLYDSKEAAEREVEFSKRHPNGWRARVGVLGNVHTDELSRERWEEDL